MHETFNFMAKILTLNWVQCHIFSHALTQNYLLGALVHFLSIERINEDYRCYVLSVFLCTYLLILFSNCFFLFRTNALMTMVILALVIGV